MANRVDEVKVYVTTPKHVPVTFSVNASGMDYFQTAIVYPGGVKEFTFNGLEYALRNTTDRSKGIVISVEDDKQVFVYAAHDLHRATDSFLAIPPLNLEAESYTYIAAMIHTLDKGNLGAGKTDIHALIGIVSAEDDTLLTITPTQNVTIGTVSATAGESVNFTLHAQG